MTSTATEHRFVIAVDGPAGAGKGTVCRAVAIRFGLRYLDTGVLYRATALLALRQQMTEADEIAATAATMPLSFARDSSGTWRTFLGEEEVTLSLRDEAVGNMASRVATMPPVRAALLAFQRHYGGEHPLILDGRDTGTVVWPEADLKIFLVADVDARAERRVEELQRRGEPVNFPRVRADIVERDARDAMRAHAPLTPATDAIILDTTHLTEEESIERVVQLVSRYLPASQETTPH